MSESFLDGLNGIINVEQTEDDKKIKNVINEKNIINDEKKPSVPFNTLEFAQELNKISEETNYKRSLKASNITGYDIARTCIKAVIYKLKNTPLESYANKWLPILMRSTIGTAIHDFIQTNTSQINEIEPAIIVPSLQFYGKIDGLISDDILVEIKSCSYKDYKKIITERMPRESDYMQAMSYRYILENHLEECKSEESISRISKYNGVVPKLNKYNINKLQFIYIAHDLLSSDVENPTQMLKQIDEIKEFLNSKKTKDEFFFMTTIDVDLKEEDKIITDSYFERKFNHIFTHLKNDTLPTKKDEFIIHKDCFFCPYSKICK